MIESLGSSISLFKYPILLELNILFDGFLKLPDILMSPAELIPTPFWDKLTLLPIWRVNCGLDVAIPTFPPEPGISVPK